MRGPAGEERRADRARARLPGARLLDDRELAAFDHSPSPGHDLANEAINSERRGAYGVGRQAQAARCRIEQRRAVSHQARQMLEQVPHLVVGPATELRRIDEDNVVSPPAADLATDELAGIIKHPANGCARQT